jgi:hypothetical protein
MKLIVFSSPPRGELDEFWFPRGNLASSLPLHLSPIFLLNAGIYIRIKDCSLWSSRDSSSRVFTEYGIGANCQCSRALSIVSYSKRSRLLGNYSSKKGRNNPFYVNF